MLTTKASERPSKRLGAQIRTSWPTEPLRGSESDSKGLTGPSEAGPYSHTRTLFSCTKPYGQRLGSERLRDHIAKVRPFGRAFVVSRWLLVGLPGNLRKLRQHINYRVAKRRDLTVRAYAGGKPGLVPETPAISFFTGRDFPAVLFQPVTASSRIQ